MSAITNKIEEILTTEYSTVKFVEFMQEIFSTMELVAPNNFRQEFSNFNSYIVGSTHIGNYKTPENKKIAIFSVQLRKESFVENSRSTQRNYIKRIIENGNCDAAIVAFYTDGESKWRLSFVRLDYELVIEKGKLKTLENITPAKRYSFLVGKGEPCHTAISRFHKFIIDENYTPSIEEVENAFSVEKVTKEFFEKYCEKFCQLEEYLSGNDDFVQEAMRCGFTSEQFAKKLMGQIVFLYFLQKKGWLGVKVWNNLTENEYKNIFFVSGGPGKIIKKYLPKLYAQQSDGNYKFIGGKELDLIPDDEEEIIANNMPLKNSWGNGSQTFLRTIFNYSQTHKKGFFQNYLEPIFYNTLNTNRGTRAYCCVTHSRIPFLSGGLFSPIKGYEWAHTDFKIPDEFFSNIDEKGNDADGILDIFDRYNFTMAEDEPLEKEVAIDPEMLGKVFENLLEIKDRKSKGAFYTPREIVHYMCQESIINYLVTKTGLPEEDIRDFILYGDFMRSEDTVKEKREGNGGMYIAETIFYINNDGKIVTNKLKDIDEALRTVRICDPAVGSGAFPMGIVSEIVKARQTITEYLCVEAKISAKYSKQSDYLTRKLHKERTAYLLKQNAIKNSIFAVDIEPSAVDICQLRLWLSLVIDDNLDERESFETSKCPMPLPNLECNILCGDSLVDEFDGISLVPSSDILGTEISNQLTMEQFAARDMLDKYLKAQDELFYCDNTVKKEELLTLIEQYKCQLIQAQFSGCDYHEIEKFNKAYNQQSKPFTLWQLDFARVFRDNGGFDIVIGNPPYVQMSKLPGVAQGYKDYLKKRYKTSGGRLNLYIFMIHLGVELLCQKGIISYIIPNTLLTQEYYTDTREMLLKKHSLISLVDYCNMPFENAVVENITFVASKLYKENYKIQVLKGTSRIIKPFKEINVNSFLSQKNYAFNINSNDLVEKLFVGSTPLNKLCNINQAIALKGDKSLSVKKDYDPKYYKLLDGRNISKYGIRWSGNYLDYSLERIHSCKKKDIFECSEKLLFRRVSSTLIATYDDEQYYALNTLVVITPKIDLDLKYILALLNSKLMNYIYSNKYKSTKNVFSEIQARTVGELPIRLSKEYATQVTEIVDEMLLEKSNNFDADISYEEKNLDNIVYKIYELSQEEINIIENS